MATFYAMILGGYFEESCIWPSVPETQSTDFKVGDLVAYLYIWPYLAMPRTNSTSSRAGSNRSFWAVWRCS